MMKTADETSDSDDGSNHTNRSMDECADVTPVDEALLNGGNSVPTPPDPAQETCDVTLRRKPTMYTFIQSID